jgi:hypothetical protein
MGDVVGEADGSHSLAELGTRHLDYAAKIIAAHLGCHPQGSPHLQTPLCLPEESPTSKAEIVADRLVWSQSLKPERQWGGALGPRALRDMGTRVPSHQDGPFWEMEGHIP